MTVQNYKNLRKNPYLCPDMEDRRNLYELLQEFRKPDLADIGSIFGAGGRDLLLPGSNLLAERLGIVPE